MGSERVGSERVHAGPALRPAREPVRDRPAPVLGPVARIQRYAGNAAGPVVWRCGSHPCGPGGCGHAGPQLARDVPVSHPADPAEQEAERVAGEVMRAVDAPELEEEPEEELARSAEGPALAPTPGLAGAIAGARGGGRPLDGEVRGVMEQHLGYDLGAVRVHTGAAAGELARQVNARAFTTGSDLFFGAGQYRPGEPDGQRLIAHELVHVVQQGAAGPGPEAP